MWPTLAGNRMSHSLHHFNASMRRQHNSRRVEDAGVPDPRAGRQPHIYEHDDVLLALGCGKHCSYLWYIAETSRVPATVHSVQLSADPLHLPGGRGDLHLPPGRVLPEPRTHRAGYSAASSRSCVLFLLSGGGEQPLSDNEDVLLRDHYTLLNELQTW